SPALVLEAMQMDDSGILESIEEIVLSDQMRERFRQNPVQELDIVIPPGFE
ncbi:MAG: hypothetical protein HY747_09275, partial [Elusimicrobia bacterium]|nr:hypothetical protein [Elusimicrobiota bacterium]